MPASHDQPDDGINNIRVGLDCRKTFQSSCVQKFAFASAMCNLTNVVALEQDDDDTART